MIHLPSFHSCRLYLRLDADLTEQARDPSKNVAVGLFGSSGSGKTTALDGLVTAFAGSLRPTDTRPLLMFFLEVGMDYEARKEWVRPLFGSNTRVDATADIILGDPPRSSWEGGLMYTPPGSAVYVPNPSNQVEALYHLAQDKLTKSECTTNNAASSRSTLLILVVSSAAIDLTMLISSGLSSGLDQAPV